MTIPATAQVVCSGTMFDSETWANVFHVNVEPGDFTSTDAANVQSEFLEYYNDVKARRSNNWALTQITVRDIREEAQETFLYPQTGVVGASSVVPIPPQVAMVVTLRTNTNSRRGRGRTYLNGFVSTTIGNSSGQFTTGHINNEGADFSDLGMRLIVADHALLVSSRTDGASRKVESITIDSVPDTQRRRVKDLAPAFRGVYGVSGPP